MRNNGGWLVCCLMVVVVHAEWSFPKVCLAYASCSSMPLIPSMLDSFNQKEYLEDIYATSDGALEEDIILLQQGRYAVGGNSHSHSLRERIEVKGIQTSNSPA